MTTKETNVLVVEDDLQTLNLERLILEGGGYTVTSALRGEEAIDMVADASPDLILLDIGLPGIDGFTTCKVIRKFSQVPIIMVTARDSLEDKVKGLDLGADDYIAKPFSEAELFARSRSVLRRSNGSGRAIRQVNLLRGKIQKSVKAIDYTEKAHSVWQGASQPLYNLINRVGKQQVAAPEVSNDGTSPGHVGLAEEPRLAACLRAVWLKVLITCARMLDGILWLSDSLYRGLCRLAGSLPMGRVKASSPATKLASAVSRFRRSDFAQRTGSDALFLRETVVSTARDVLARRGKGEYPSPERLQSPTPPVYAPDIAELPGTDGSTSEPETPFLEKLLRAYLREAETRCSDPMISVPVVALVDVYQQMLASYGLDGEYSKEEFARDVYLLHCSGVDRTPTGAKVQFPISRGVPNKTLIVTDDAGREVKYYGVRFTQTETENLPESTPGRLFNDSEAAQYRAELKEALRQQLDWPSEAFARFMSAHLNFRELDQREVRQFAQITRDALQELFKAH